MPRKLRVWCGLTLRGRKQEGNRTMLNNLQSDAKLLKDIIETKRYKGQKKDSIKTIDRIIIDLTYLQRRGVVNRIKRVFGRGST